MIIDLALIGLLVYHPSIRFAAWIVVLLAFRHVPLLANRIACDLQLESYAGATAWLAHVLLPGWRSSDLHMSSADDGRPETPRAPVHVPIPDTAGSRDTTAIQYHDDESARDQFLDIMCDQKDERGGYLFSANQIHAALGGHRATVLARVRDRRSRTLPPVYRDENGALDVATHPVTKSAP